MPTVPTLSENQIQARALPGVRLNTDVSPDAFGAGIGRALGQVAEVANDYAIKARNEAEEVQAFEIDAKLQKIENSLLFDPEKGALMKQGRNALGLPEIVQPEFDKAAAEIENSVTSPRVKLATRKMVERRRLSLSESLSRHVAKESQKYQAATFEDAADTALNTAGLFYNDPARVAVSIRQGEEAITRKAAVEGVPAENALMEFRSRAHKQVINAALAKDDYESAAAYYEANRESMSADDAAAVGKVVREGEIKVRGRAMADRIAASVSTMAGALGQVNAIEDPEMRDEVKRRVKERLAERETIKREVEESEMKAAYQAIEAGENPDDFSPARRLALADKMPTLRRAWDEKVGGTEPKTDYGVYLTRLEEANKNPQAFAKRNLFDDAASLRREDFERLLKAQSEIRSGKAGPELTFINTLDETVKSKYMGATGKNTLAKADNAKLASFTEVLQKAVQEEERLSGKKMTRTEIEAKADQLLLQGMVDPSGWFNTREFLAYELAPEDIPEAERMEIIKSLQKRGIPVTTSNIQSLYTAKNARTD